MIALSCADSGSVSRVADVLLRGGVAVIPTDTVYGLAAHPGCLDAVARLASIKGRSRSKPIALLASDVGAAEAFAGGLSPVARGLAEAHWPGALTLVVPCVGGNGAEVLEGLRVPAHSWTRGLLAACGGVLRVTSANLSGGKPALDVGEALASLGLQADVLADDGPCRGGVASTVAQVCGDGSVRVLREGPVQVGCL
ncbi:MAG: L-threonylcarbamoyladenylate synthase [Kiritimatiellia bacterium]